MPNIIFMLVVFILSVAFILPVFQTMMDDQLGFMNDENVSSPVINITDDAVVNESTNESRPTYADDLVDRDGLNKIIMLAVALMICCVVLFFSFMPSDGWLEKIKRREKKDKPASDSMIDLKPEKDEQKKEIVVSGWRKKKEK